MHAGGEGLHMHVQCTRMGPVPPTLLHLYACILTGAGRLHIGHLDCRNGSPAHITSLGGAVDVGGMDGDVQIASHGGAISLQAMDGAGVISACSDGGDINCSVSPCLVERGVTISAVGAHTECDVPGMSRSSRRRSMRDRDQAVPSETCLFEGADHGAVEDVGSRPMIALHAQSGVPGTPHGKATIRRRSWIEAITSKRGG